MTLSRWLVPIMFLVLGGCQREALPGVAMVRMADNTFSPTVVHVPVGSPVLFRNMGRLPHNALAVTGEWGSDKVLGELEVTAGRWAEVRFDKPGVYHYYCSFHGTKDGAAGMVGTVVVGDVEYHPDSAKAALPVVEAATGVTRAVPGAYATVQAAVDAAAPGDLVLVAPGTYHEEVSITTPSLTIRGEDRNTVVLDGQFVRSNGIAIFADAVAVENLTVKGYTLNGIFWSGVTGYRGSYLTALNNGDYGLFAYEATDGVIEDSYANGSPDSGFYIGACQPCNAVVRRVIAERNGLGFSGTNAGGELYVIDSDWSRNHGPGLAPNTFDIEPFPPQRGGVFMGNLVQDNATNGFSLLGANANLIARNRIERNAGAGIFLLGQKDRNYYPSTNNRIVENLIAQSGHADLAVSGFGNLGNCFQDNAYRTVRPAMLVAWQPCQGRRLPVFGETASYFTTASQIAALTSDNAGDIRGGDWWKQEPPPPDQPNLPGGAGAPVVPPVHPFVRPDTSRIALPGSATRER